MAICGLCFDDSSDFFNHDGCSGVAVCVPCARTFLKIKVTGREASPWYCPAGCQSNLTPEIIRKYLPEENLVEYDEFLQHHKSMMAQRDQRLRRILPSPTDMVDNLAFMAWSSSIGAKRCPGCRVLIEKNGGCQHMTCRSCRHEFFWCCGQTYRGTES